jgi:hypothetical protein
LLSEDPWRRVFRRDSSLEMLVRTSTPLHTKISYQTRSRLSTCKFCELRSGTYKSPVQIMRHKCTYHWPRSQFTMRYTLSGRLTASFFQRRLSSAVLGNRRRLLSAFRAIRKCHLLASRCKGLCRSICRRGLPRSYNSCSPNDF